MFKINLIKENVLLLKLNKTSVQKVEQSDKDRFLKIVQDKKKSIISLEEKKKIDSTKIKLIGIISILTSLNLFLMLKIKK